VMSGRRPAVSRLREQRQPPRRRLANSITPFDVYRSNGVRSIVGGATRLPPPFGRSSLDAWRFARLRGRSRACTRAWFIDRIAEQQQQPFARRASSSSSFSLALSSTSVTKTRLIQRRRFACHEREVQADSRLLVFLETSLRVFPPTGRACAKCSPFVRVPRF